MRKNRASQSGIFNPRVLFVCALCSMSFFLAMLSFGSTIRGRDASQHHVQATKTNSVAIATQPTWKQIGSYTPPPNREMSTMVFDPDTQTTILFGGSTLGWARQNDTWSFDGQRWTQLHPVDSPPPRSGASAAYDAAHHQIVLFGGYSDAPAPGFMNDTWTWDGTNWTQHHPTTSPPARMLGAMAYDPATSRVVLFGGVANVDLAGSIEPLGDTWIWDGDNWTQQIAPISPTPRYSHGFADGSATSPPVLFGGETNEDSQLNDTWTWDGALGTWLPQAAAGPAIRAAPGMAVDPATGRAVLFGGYINATGVDTNHPLGAVCQGIQINAVCFYNDTWIWNGNQWTQATPSTSPAPRGRTVMAFDAVRGKTELFGGFVFGGNANDTWSFDGSNWKQEDIFAPDELNGPMLARESSAGTAILFGGQGERYSYSQQTWRWEGSTWRLLAPAHMPLERGMGALVYDSATATTILFGGYVDSYLYPGTRLSYNANDTWSWDGNDWTQLSPATSPSGRLNAGAAYDAATGEIVLFGGFGDSGPLGDTWIWDGANWIEQHPVNSPPARMAPSMVYNATTHEVMLFGGNTPTGDYFNDTWIWNGTDWIELQPAHSPPPRAQAALAYDPQSGSDILFAGCVNCNASIYGDTWTWNGSDWTEIQIANPPPARTNLSIVDGTSSSPLLIFGGAQNPLQGYQSGTAMLNDLWAFGSPQAVVPTSVVSRKIHGSSSTFDIDLPLTGNPGIECRSSGANGDYTLVFKFTNPLSNVGGASVTSGIGSASGNIDSNDAHNYMVNLTGVTNAQTITVSLSNVTDSVGDFSGAVAVSMGVLIGDIDASRLVDGNDVSAVQSHTRQSVNGTNFRYDVNTSGVIDGNDVSITQGHTRTSLP